MSQPISGHTALVTGAASGIGKGIATRLVAEVKNRVHFAVIGDGPQREALRALSASLGLSRVVHAMPDPTPEAAGAGFGQRFTAPAIG